MKEEKGSGHSMPWQHGITLQQLQSVASLLEGDGTMLESASRSFSFLGAAVLVSLPFGFSNNSAYVFRRNQGGPGQWGGAARLAARDSFLAVTVSGNIVVLGNPDSGELHFPETYVFNLAPLLIAGDIPALGPFGLAAMALLLLAAGWISVRRRTPRPAGAPGGTRSPG
jgi:hypothetical protein